MTYTKEDLNTDEEWLREQGVDTSEVTDFLINLIKQGFKMDRKEFVLFLKEVEEDKIIQ